MTPTQRAAQLIADADGLLIIAGAGMGVDSGLPDFRGAEGFWRAYPALKKAGIDFTSIASPGAFVRAPRLAWGFYGHRLALYRQAVPHHGFQIIDDIAAQMPKGMFAVTSNVDGQFQSAGFSESHLMEIHGSIHHLQCITPCTEDIWSASGITSKTDDSKCKWLGRALPTCPICHRLARPNICMFNDYGWIETNRTAGKARLDRWLEKVDSYAILEIGVGTGVATLRRLGKSLPAPLIRINPQDDGVLDDAEITLKQGALTGLNGIRKKLASIGWMPEAGGISCWSPA